MTNYVFKTAAQLAAQASAVVSAERVYRKCDMASEKGDFHIQMEGHEAKEVLNPPVEARLKRDGYVVRSTRVERPVQSGFGANMDGTEYETVDVVNISWPK